MDVWHAASSVVSTRLLYVEASAALAQANRSGRITVDALDSAGRSRDDLWRSVSVVDLDDTLMRRAGEIAEEFGLRGYGAVHCAAASLLSGPNFVAASGDAKLLAAWHELGVATVDPAQFA